MERRVIHRLVFRITQLINELLFCCLSLITVKFDINLLYKEVTTLSYSYTGQMPQKNKKTNRPLVLISLIIAMFMSAIEGTIVATAMPNIVGDLGGFSLYSWVFSSFLLMTAVTTMIYGKLSDLFGRKPIYVFGVIVFLIGSILCGFATSMTMLIIFRFIQGIGAGAVQPVATTIVGDIYSVEERAKIQGYLSSVWGISAIVGPLAGGLIVQYSDWAWIFWVNIPLGIIGMIGVIFFLHESVEKEEKNIDYTESALFFISITALMLLFIESGVDWAWLSSPTFILAGTFAVFMYIFIWWEKRTKAPMMPLYLWQDKLISFANIATLTSGAIVIGLTSFLPTYVQGVMGYSAVVAGFTLTMMSVGWPIASSLAGYIFLKIGFRKTAIIGGFALFLGAILFLFLDVAKGPIWAGAGSFVIGVGMGLTSTTFIVAIQNHVGWKTRGIATASNMFMRMIGSSLGVALLGGVLNTKLKAYMENIDVDMDQNISADSINSILDPETIGDLSEHSLNVLRTGLDVSLTYVFWGIFIFAIVTLIFSFFLPKPDKHY